MQAVDSKWDGYLRIYITVQLRHTLIDHHHQKYCRPYNIPQTEQYCRRLQQICTTTTSRPVEDFKTDCPLFAPGQSWDSLNITVSNSPCSWLGFYLFHPHSTALQSLKSTVWFSLYKRCVSNFLGGFSAVNWYRPETMRVWCSSGKK